MTRWIAVSTCCAALAFSAGAGAGEGDERAEPDRVTVQHVLVGFKRSIPGRDLERSRKEAEALAREILDRARAGEDFAALVREYTDDRFPGIHKLCNKGVEPALGEKRRFDMVTYFGNVAFDLAVGEVGLAEYHATRSPFGYHVIKRLE